MSNTTKPLLTTTTRDGLQCLAKSYKGQPSIKTYANITQAQKAADAAGEGWFVSARWPYLVLRAQESA